MKGRKKKCRVHMRIPVLQNIVITMFFAGSDFADTLGILDYNRIEVYLKDGKNWAGKSAQEFVEEVRSDLEFDGCEPVLEFEIRKALLEIKLTIE